jgi:hypothetical protein
MVELGAVERQATPLRVKLAATDTLLAIVVARLSAASARSLAVSATSRACSSARLASSADANSMADSNSRMFWGAFV